MMPFRKSCHMPFRKLIPLFNLTGPASITTKITKVFAPRKKRSIGFRVAHVSIWSAPFCHVTRDTSVDDLGGRSQLWDRFPKMCDDFQCCFRFLRCFKESSRNGSNYETNIHSFVLQTKHFHWSNRHSCLGKLFRLKTKHARKKRLRFMVERNL